jgi:hypothetical protein
MPILNNDPPLFVPDEDIDQTVSDSSPDRFGLSLSILVLTAALVLMVIWLIAQPSFAKCSGLGSQSERVACYQRLRDQLLSPPAKGGSDAALENAR